jgi:hypothetical protein
LFLVGLGYRRSQRGGARCGGVSAPLWLHTCRILRGAVQGSSGGGILGPQEGLPPVWSLNEKTPVERGFSPTGPPGLEPGTPGLANPDAPLKPPWLLGRAPVVRQRPGARPPLNGTIRVRDNPR